MSAAYIVHCISEGTSSSHSSSKHGATSASSKSSKHGGINSTYTLTKTGAYSQKEIVCSFGYFSFFPSTESDQLSSFILRMRKLFSTYLTLHPPASASSSSSSSSSSSYSSTEELRLCYHEVPDVFFRPDFALTTPQTFSVVCGGSNQSGVLLYTIVTLLRVFKPHPHPHPYTT